MLYLQLPSDITDPPVNKSRLIQSQPTVNSSMLLITPIDLNRGAGSSTGGSEVYRSTTKSADSKRTRDMYDTIGASRTRRRRRPRSLLAESVSDRSNIHESTDSVTSTPSIDCLLHTHTQSTPPGFGNFENFFEDFPLTGMPLLRQKYRLLSTADFNYGSTVQTMSASSSLASETALPPSSRPQSLAVGSTGMVIHLMDSARYTAVISTGNDTDSSQQADGSQKESPELNPNYIEAIGESSLPMTFKNLQRSAAASRFEPGVLGLGLAFGLGTGGNGVAQTCQFSIRLKEPPMETNMAKDQHWQYLNQLLSNVTNVDPVRLSGVEMSEEDKELEADRVAAVAKKNAAYASMVSGTSIVKSSIRHCCCQVVPLFSCPSLLYVRIQIGQILCLFCG
jgi:hypothetical protein